MSNFKSVDLSTAAFVRAHGKQPRGYGQWAFCPAQHYDRPDYMQHVKWFTGTFADAKRSAVAYYRDMPGVNTVVVCS